jgi:hypothetical protein
MEQAHEAKVPVQAEACDPAMEVKVAVVALQQVRAEIVSAQTAVKRCPINWEHPAWTRSAQNAALL